MSLRNSPKGLPRFDWVLFITYLALVGIGLMMIFATTYYDIEGGNIFSPNSTFGRQAIWAAISLVALLALVLIDWQIFNSLAIPIYALGIISLVLVLLFGREIKGATSWIAIGPFSIQPSEFAKLTTAIYIAGFLSVIRNDLRKRWTQLVSVGIFLLPAALILLQPDAGSAITFFSLLILLYRKGLPSLYFIVVILLFLTVVFTLIYGISVALTILFLMMAAFLVDFSKMRMFSIMLLTTLILVSLVCFQFEWSLYSAILNGVATIGVLYFFNPRQSIGTKFSLLGGVAMLVLISFSSLFAFNNVLKPHQQDRINVWLQPEKCDPRGSLYNLLQSKLAIGSGGLTGKGYLDGTFTKLNYVPEQTTDFIFSTIGEEQGFIGGVAVIILFLLLIVRIIQKGEHSKYPFVKNYSYAIAGFIFLHFFVNIGMTMGISPVIGIPLPFISKGGSSLLAFSMMIGIALNMYKSR